MAAVEKPESPPVPAAEPSPKDIPTDAFSTNAADQVSEPSDPYPFRVIWPEPPTADGPVSEPGAHKQLGPYELLGEIARGGMGVIYKARDTRLNRLVALKMLRTGPLSRPEELQRFHREAKAQAQIQHRHILPI